MTVAFNGAPARHAQTTNIYVFLMVLWSRVTDYQSINVISSDGGGKKRPANRTRRARSTKRGIDFPRALNRKKGKYNSIIRGEKKNPTSDHRYEG